MAVKLHSRDKDNPASANNYTSIVLSAHLRTTYALTKQKLIRQCHYFTLDNPSMWVFLLSVGEVNCLLYQGVYQSTISCHISNFFVELRTKCLIENDWINLTLIDHLLLN